jgi:hypothetical protein
MAGINTLNAELNPICHLLALLGAHHILHVSRIRVHVARLCTNVPTKALCTYVLHVHATSFLSNVVRTLLQAI